MHRSQNEGDQRNTGDAIGFETIGGRPHRIARVIPGAIGDHAGISRVVFLDFESDLHQVGTDIRDLRKDAARHSQSCCAERFPNGESDKAGTG